MSWLAVRSIELRGVPIWRLREYLAELGAVDAQAEQPNAAAADGAVHADGAMRADRWAVAWRSEQRPFHPRLSTTIDEHVFIFSAVDQPTVDAIFERFMLKAQRGGG